MFLLVVNIILRLKAVLGGIGCVMIAWTELGF